jgi:Protein of unknown function (DUF3575)
MHRKIIFVAFSLFSSVAAIAQTEVAKEEKKAAVKKHHPMNYFKVNVTAIALKTYSFQYERVLSKRFSVALGYRTMPVGALPFKSTIINSLGDDQDAIDQLNKFNFGNTAITPEIRFYTGRKGYGRGFYLAPYYRNATYKGNGLSITYQNNANVESTMSMAGDIKSSTFGLLLGAQWALGKHVSLDWWILGPNYGSGKGSFSGKSSVPLTVDEQADLKQELEDFDVPFSDKTVTVNANGASVKLDGPFAGLRAGILIGIRF